MAACEANRQGQRGCRLVTWPRGTTPIPIHQFILSVEGERAISERRVWMGFRVFAGDLDVESERGRERERTRARRRRGRCTTRQDAPVSQIHKADLIGCIIPVIWLQNGKQDCKYLPVVLRSLQVKQSQR